MKKLILSAIACTALCLGQLNAQTANATGHATTQKAEMTPEQESAKHAAKLTRELGLTEDQKAKVQAYDLERINANAPLKEKAGSSASDADKKSAHQQIKANNEKFEASVQALLTDDQKAKWDAHKKDMEAKRKEKRAAGANANESK